jgi:hypothetical protein
VIEWIVVAMPRSGSYWLTELLKEAGAFAQHDALSEAQPEELAARAVAARELGFSSVGFVETAGMFFHEELDELYPTARKVYLLRDVASVAKSLANLGFDDPKFIAHLAWSKIVQQHKPWNKGTSITYGDLFHGEAGILSQKIADMTDNKCVPTVELIERMREANLQSPKIEQLIQRSKR